MFSRSDKTEEAADAFGEPSTQRSPMMLAALAGLLAIAGAFLLVFYLRGDDGDVAQEGEAAAATAEASRQVLVVTQTIPRGTSVREIVEAPTVYLSARAVPEQFVAASAITSVAELSELEGFVLLSDALPGEQLLKGRFSDPSSFDNESLLETVTVVDAPPGHHLIVVPLPASRALGGRIGSGDVVTVVGNFRIKPPGEPDSESVEISLVVLPAVEVINVEGTLEVSGQVASDAATAGTANRGSYNLTLAVEPDELTDLTYTMEYGEIMLAVALDGANNDDTPRAATLIEGVLGDDSVWIDELADGNVLELLISLEEGSSIEVEAAEDGDEDDVPQDDVAEDDVEDGDLQPGDS